MPAVHTHTFEMKFGPDDNKKVVEGELHHNDRTDIKFTSQDGVMTMEELNIVENVIKAYDELHRAAIEVEKIEITLQE